MSLLVSLRKSLWICVILVDFILTSEVQAEKLLIERTNEDHEFVHYELVLDKVDVANIAMDRTSFRQRVLLMFADRIDRDRRLGIIDDQIPKLSVVGIVRDDEEEFAVGELIIDLGRTWAKREAEDRVLFTASLTRDYRASDVVVGALTEEQQKTLNVGPRLWETIADLALSIEGKRLQGDALVNFAVRAALDDPDKSSGMRGTVIAVGVWLGDELIANDGYEWVNLTDSYGSCLCVHKRTPSGEHRYSDPFNVVRKRLNAGEAFDARALVTALLASLNSL